MNSILENPLVKKYFGCEDFGEVSGIIHDHGVCEMRMPARVFQAMQEPIKKGERYILIDCEWPPREKTAESNSLEHGRHLGALRLPDCFQPAPEWEKCDCKCHMSYAFKRTCCKDYQPPPSEAKAECDCGCHGKDCTNEGKYGQACCPKESPAKTTESSDDDTCTKCGMFHIPAGSPCTPPAPALSEAVEAKIKSMVNDIDTYWSKFGFMPQSYLEENLRNLCRLVMREAKK